MKRIIASLLLLSTVFSAYGDPLSSEQIRQKLLLSRPGLPIGTVTKSPLDGFYQVELEGGGQMLYVSEDGDHFFAGDLYRVTSAEFVNLTEDQRSLRRREIMGNLDESEMLVFSPKERKAQITVFTDIDCSYCRKLHLEVPALNRMGIAVRYLAYPRAGIDSDSYKKIVSAWCAENPQIALTRAKRGQEIESRTCANPVAEHYRIGGEIGVTGTPALVLDDGQLLPGYVPATRLAAMMGVHPEVP